MKRPLMVSLYTLGLAFVAACASPAQAGRADQAVGIWLTKAGSNVKFYRCGTKLCGKIIKRKNPGELDSKNSNAKLRGRKILGINLLYDLKKDTPDRWAGKLYNPEDGKTYAGFVTVLSAGNVRMEGCIARIFCKKQIWSRVR